MIIHDEMPSSHVTEMHPLAQRRMESPSSGHPYSTMCKKDRKRPVLLRRQQSLHTEVILPQAHAQSNPTKLLATPSDTPQWNFYCLLKISSDVYGVMDSPIHMLNSL